jgi:serine phosphatase RsbU (regulator of sigma subunit)
MEKAGAQEKALEFLEEKVEERTQEVVRQSYLIEEKQKEIIDSITYAKRLQQAILPSDEEIKKLFPESFIYYQPKDIVAGDFYWMETLSPAGRDGEGFTYIAAADSTGHGVPGAMVSVVCSNALNRAVKEFGLRNTGEILDKTRELVIETFEKSDKNVKDGMDISLLRLKTFQVSETWKVSAQWSGANNSLWYFQNGALTEIKANKQPIGKYNTPVPFATHSIEFTSGTSFYLFSDGYADQFSSSDKKLMTKKFKEVLLSIQQLPMHEQGNHLEKFHINWKGNMEQTDDVLVIGIKV